MTVVSPELASGDKRRALVALRDHLAARLDEGVASRDLAPITKQLADLVETLDAMPDGEEKSAANDIVAKLERARALRASGA